MHSISYLEMEKNLKEHLGERFEEELVVLEIGSKSQSMSYKPLISPPWKYIGADLKKGTNVNVVMKGPYEIPFEDEEFDVVISGQCFEHAANPFKLMKEAARVLKKGGWMFHVAPFMYPRHDKPDRFRFLPDGWKSIFREAEISMIKTYFLNANEIISAYNTEKAWVHKGRFSDCWAIGRKP